MLSSPTTDTEIDNIVAEIKANNLEVSAQKVAIIKTLVERYPDIGNREIAKVADVPVDLIIDYRKPRPKAGITDEKWLTIRVLLWLNPNEQKQIAEQLSVTIGVVAGIKNRARVKARKKGAPRPLAERTEKRINNVPRFDSLTREERGMGSREHGAQQHPAAPQGWSNDDVHRRDHGRIVLFTPDQAADHKLIRKFNAVAGDLARLHNGLRQLSPEALETIRPRLEMFVLKLHQLGPDVIAMVQALLDKTGQDSTRLN